MYLACVELTGDDRTPGARPLARGGCSRVVQLKFPQLETAKVWAQEEATRHREATGNAAVFETLGPFMSLAWEMDAAATDGGDHVETPPFSADRLAQRA